MRQAWRELCTTIFKTAFGTDERALREPMPELDCHKDKADKPTSSQHTTDVLAAHAERKIDSMNAATERLSRLGEASNLTEALLQITGE